MENSIDHIITRILSGNSSSEDFLSLSEWLNADEKNKKEFRLLKSYWDAEVSFSHSLMPNVSLDNLRKKIDDQSRQKRLRLIRFIATPIAAASRCIAGRKPTPCTTPLISSTSRIRIFSITAAVQPASIRRKTLSDIAE